MKKIMLIAAAALLVLSSCASFIHMQDTNTVNSFTDLINTGKTDKLVKMSKTPFLLDQEIIVLTRDIKTLWRNIIKAGYKIKEPQFKNGEPVNENTYLEFYNSMEVKTFFKKYVKKGSRVIQFKTGNGKRIILLVEPSFFGRNIRGFKGPY
ncbi:MAG: hypothetical protein DRP57_05770 [Spirochaetes bacterium]|nr:MAG: hypothetical protein DRP57_05770 [Spirochaetota bacterium]